MPLGPTGDPRPDEGLSLRRETCCSVTLTLTNPNVHVCEYVCVRAQARASDLAKLLSSTLESQGVSNADDLIAGIILLYTPTFSQARARTYARTHTHMQSSAEVAAAARLRLQRCGCDCSGVVVAAAVWLRLQRRGCGCSGVVAAAAARLRLQRCGCGCSYVVAAAAEGVGGRFRRPRLAVWGRTGRYFHVAKRGVGTGEGRQAPEGGRPGR